MALKFARAIGGNWSTSATWSTTSGGAADTVAPTAADDVVLDANSGNVTIDTGAVCRSLNCTGYTGTLTHNSGVALAIGDATAGLSSVALTLVAGMTYTLNNSTSSSISLVSTSTTLQTLTFGGKTIGALTINGSANNYQLQDAMVMNGQFLLTLGRFDANNQNITMNDFNSNNSNVRTLTMGTGTWTLTGTSGDVWLPAATNLTSSGTSSTIVIGSVSSSGRNMWPAFALGTVSYIVSGSTGGLFIAGSVTINTINFYDATVARQLTFQNAVTYTITNFNVYGNANGRVTFTSSNPGSHTLTVASGRIICDYMNISYSAAGGGATFYAGIHSDGGPQVTGWILGAPQTKFTNTGIRSRAFAPGIAR